MDCPLLPFDRGTALLGDPLALLQAAARLGRLPVPERVRAVVRFLCRDLGLDWALVAMLEPGGRSYASLAACHRGAWVEGIRHPLTGALAADLLREPRRYLAGVRQVYPADPWLAAAGAEWAAGTPVASGGFLAVLHRRPLPLAPALTPLLELLAALAAPALEDQRRRGARDVLAQSNILLREEIQRRIAVEDQLRRQADILDRLDAAVIAVDAKDYVQGWNRGAQRLLGYGEDEILGRPLARIWPSGSGDWRSRLDPEAAPPVTETRLRDRDGRSVPVALTLHRTGGAAGDGTVLVASDLRQAHRAERALRRSEARYRRLVERMHEGLMVLDTAGRITFANEAACRLGGYRREELIGRSPEAFLWDGAGRARFRRQFNRRRRGLAGAYELVWRHRDGHPLHTLVSAEPILDEAGRFEGAFAVITDLSARHREEQARLEAVRQQRDALIREVHHRIKNHLQGVVGLLRRHLADRPQAAGALESAIRQVNAVALVHGLQAGTSHDRIVLCELLPAVARAVAAQRGAPTPETEVRVREDVQLAPKEAVPMALVINELVTNAFKHGGGGPVRLVIEGGPRRVAVRVQSTGRLPEGFDLERGRGLGTGLALVRALLPKPGSRLTIEQDRGSVTARLTLAPPVVGAATD